MGQRLALALLDTAPSLQLAELTAGHYTSETLVKLEHVTKHANFKNFRGLGAEDALAFLARILSSHSIAANCC